MSSEPTWDFSAVNEDGAASSSRSTEPSSENVRQRSSRQDAGSHHHNPNPKPSSPASASQGQAQGSRKKRPKQYGPRSCRICLDIEYPYFQEVGSTLLGISTTSSKPIYTSSDPKLGRLLSPCNCKGSQRYVHEGCLNAWRATNPLSDRVFWQCPTCKFTYRLTRLSWASMLSSRVAQITLTAFAMAFGVFLLGFIADPIMDLWFDPMGAIVDTVSDVFSDVEGLAVHYEEPTSWTEHWLKGFFSLGLVGIVQSFFSNPWTWYSFRAYGGAGGGGRRRGGTGQSRYQNMSLLFVLLGAFTFMMATWRFVKAISARVLQRVSERVLDVGDDSDGYEEESAQPST